MKWDPAVWREPTWMAERREFGIKVWMTGAEINFGKQLVRFRWVSR